VRTGNINKMPFRRSDTNFYNIELFTIEFLVFNKYNLRKTSNQMHFSLHRFHSCALQRQIATSATDNRNWGVVFRCNLSCAKDRWDGIKRETDKQVRKCVHRVIILKRTLECKFDVSIWWR
jgi:hypothetical protein